MFAPTIGGVPAVVFAHGRIRFGRPTKHVLFAFLPPLVILVSTWMGSLVSDVSVHAEHLVMLLALSPILALSGCVSAIGE